MLIFVSKDGGFAWKDGDWEKMPEPTLEEQRELFASMVDDAEHELRYAREKLKEVEREIARRDLQKPSEK